MSDPHPVSQSLPPGLSVSATRSLSLCHPVSQSLPPGLSVSVTRSLSLCHPVSQSLPPGLSVSATPQVSVTRSLSLCHPVSQSLSPGLSVSATRSLSLYHPAGFCPRTVRPSLQVNAGSQLYYSAGETLRLTCSVSESAVPAPDLYWTRTSEDGTVARVSV